MAQTEVFSHFLEGTKAMVAEKKGKGRRGKQAEDAEDAEMVEQAGPYAVRCTLRSLTLVPSPARHMYYVCGVFKRRLGRGSDQTTSNTPVVCP